VTLFLGLVAWWLLGPGEPGTLFIDSTPTGADILLNGQVRAKTPHLIANLAPGTYEVRLRLEGYQDHLVTLRLGSGEAKTLTDVQLTRVR
jgi:hypothetical protein